MSQPKRQVPTAGSNKSGGISVNTLIIPGRLNCGRTLRDFRVRCIALAALHWLHCTAHFRFTFCVFCIPIPRTITRHRHGEEIRAHNVLRGSSWLDPNINSISGGHANVHHECASAGSTLWLILSFCSGCDTSASFASAGSLFKFRNCTNGSHKNM